MSASTEAVADGSFSGKLHRFKKVFTIDAMFLTGVVNCLKSCEGTPDATHLKVQEKPNGRRPSAHHTIDGQVEIDSECLLGHSLFLAGTSPRSLRGGKQASNIWDEFAEAQRTRAPKQAYSHQNRAIARKWVAGEKLTLRPASEAAAALCLTLHGRELRGPFRSADRESSPAPESLR